LENHKKRKDNEDNDISFYDTPAIVQIANQPSNKKMRIIIKNGIEYVCFKDNTSNEVYWTLLILKNVDDNELFKVDCQKL